MQAAKRPRDDSTPLLLHLARTRNGNLHACTRPLVDFALFVQDDMTGIGDFDRQIERLAFARMFCRRQSVGNNIYVHQQMVAVGCCKRQTTMLRNVGRTRVQIASDGSDGAVGGNETDLTVCCVEQSAGYGDVVSPKSCKSACDFHSVCLVVCHIRRQR